MKDNNKYLLPFIALTTLFFLWGFITVLVDAFIPRLREVFELSYGKAGLVQVAWFLAYLLISIPGGKIVSRLGYKKGIIAGLLISGLGCLIFIPAASFRSFYIFLMALFTLAGGITILQVAANPFVSVLGPEQKASSRLNLSQAFNSLGTTLAPIFASAFLLSDTIKSSVEINELSSAAKEIYYASEASAVQMPFLFIAVFLILLGTIFAFIKLPRILEKSDSKNRFRDALKFPQLRLGAIGIFLYVGAEVAIGSYLINYFLDMGMPQAIIDNDVTRVIATFIANIFHGMDINTIDAKAIVGTFVIFYWGGAMIGRFIGSWLTGKFNAAGILGLFGISAIFLLLITINTTGFTAMFTVLGVGLFNSIMFPTIFTLSIEGLDSYKPQASGILCTAIFGGAVIPPLFGVIADGFGFKTAFILPILCYIFIIFFAMYMRKRTSEVMA